MSAATQQPAGRAAAGWWLAAAVGALGLAAVVLGPLVVCMPPWVDTSFFDVCARVVLAGRPVYHEILIHGPPGMVLAVAGVRRLLGWRSEILALTDLAIVGTAIALLVWRCLPAGMSRGARVWTALALVLVYSATTEWCHCQPDPWMMLPALAGLSLWQAPPADAGASRRRRACLGGACWGIACLFKPFALLPALGCWLGLGRGEPGMTTEGPRRPPLGWAVFGAAIPAALTALWLAASGNWADFLEGTAGTWNRDYYRTSASGAERLRDVGVVLWPWALVQLLALPVAVAALIGREPRRSFAVGCRPELAGCYLGWFFQAHFIQRQTPYQVLPAVLLGWTVLSGAAWPRRALLAAVVVWSVCCHPLLRPERLAMWRPCWSEGSTPEIRDILTLEEDSFVAPEWKELEQVRSFLKARGVRDQELTCYSLSTVPLYLELGVRPSMRFVLLQTAQEFFPSARPRIVRELADSPQRYVVNDLRQLHLGGRALTREEAAVEIPGHPLALPPAVPAGVKDFFPFTMPVVFRAGRYLVHEVPKSEARRHLFAP